MKLEIPVLSLVVESKKEKNPGGEIRVRKISDQVRTDDICFWPLAVVSVSSELQGRRAEFSFRLVLPWTYLGFDTFVVDVSEVLRQGENQLIAGAFPVAGLDLPKGVWRLALDLAGIELREVSFRIDSFRISELVDEEGALRPGALDQIEIEPMTLGELLDE